MLHLFVFQELVKHAMFQCSIHVCKKILVPRCFHQRHGLKVLPRNPMERSRSDRKNVRREMVRYLFPSCPMPLSRDIYKEGRGQFSITLPQWILQTIGCSEPKWRKTPEKKDQKTHPNTTRKGWFVPCVSLRYPK